MATWGVIGSVGSFGDGEGAFGERPCFGRLAEVPQDQGEVGLRPAGISSRRQLRRVTATGNGERRVWTVS